MAGFDFSQGYIMDNMRTYFQQHGIDETVADGYCHALAMLWSYKRLIGEQEQCYQLFKKIEEWNQVDDLEIEFEKLISQLVWVQSNVVAGHTSHPYSVEKINLLESELPLQLEFNACFTFNEQETINFLKEILKNEGKEVLIGSNNHKVSVVFEDGVYKFFDSNRGVTEFKSIEDFVRHPEDGLIRGFNYENSRLAKILNVLNIKKTIPKYFSLSFQVFDLQGKPLGNYPKNPAENIIQARIRAKQASGVDNPSWNNTVAAHLAASFNDVSTLQTLVHHNANINAKDDEGKTPLYKSVSVRSKEAMQFLLDNGADTSVEYPSGSISHSILEIAMGAKCDAESLTILMAAAIKANQIEMLRRTIPMLISSYAVDIDKPMSDGKTLLQIAIKSGHAQIVLELIKNGAVITVSDLELANHSTNQNMINIIAGEFLHKAIQQHDLILANNLMRQYQNAKNYTSALSHESPLSTALRAGEDRLAKDLLTKQNKQTLSREGDPPFITALKHGCLETMKTLMKEPYPHTDINNNNLLHMAAQAGQPAVLAYLLQNGFEKFINTPNNTGLTPMEIALRGNSLPVVQIFINNPNTTLGNNKLKSTSLHWAAQGSTEILDMILPLSLSDVNQPDVNGRTPLCYAVVGGNLENVKHLASLDDLCLGKQNTNPKIINPLNEALAAGEIEIALFLIENYGDVLVNLPDKNGGTPLHAVFESYELSDKEQLAFTQLLIKKGARVDIADKEGKLPIHYLASTSMSTDAAQALLAEAPDTINQKDKVGMTPLHYAAQVDNVDMVKFYMSRNDSLEVMDNSGQTPVAIAKNRAQAYFKFLQFCQAVQNFQFETVEKHPDLALFLKMTDYNGNTPLHLIIINTAVQGLSVKESKKLTTMLQLLTQDPKLIDVNVKNKEGESLLQVALKYGDMKTVEFLLQNKNINIFTQNKQGENILHVLLTAPLDERDKLHWIKLFLEKAPALTYLKDKDKQTPLHHAVIIGNHNLVEAICNDVNINSRDAMGKTPLHFAVETGNIQLIHLLIMRGADLNLADKAGLTPMQMATNMVNKDPSKQNILEQMTRSSEAYIKQTTSNIHTIEKVFTEISTLSTSQDRLKVALTKSLGKISKNQPEEQYKQLIISEIENKLKLLEPKNSDKPFALFSRNTKNDIYQESKKMLTGIISQLQSTKILTIQ